MLSLTVSSGCVCMLCLSRLLDSCSFGSPRGSVTGGVLVFSCGKLPVTGLLLSGEVCQVTLYAGLRGVVKLNGVPRPALMSFSGVPWFRGEIKRFTTAGSLRSGLSFNPIGRRLCRY